MAAMIFMGKPRQASAAAMQCLAEFGLYHYLRMTLQEEYHVTLCPQWKIVLKAMIESCRNELQSKAIKKNRWNNREADRQARPFWTNTRDLAHFPARECPGAAGSNTMTTGCSSSFGGMECCNRGVL